MATNKDSETKAVPDAPKAPEKKPKKAAAQAKPVAGRKKAAQGEARFIGIDVTPPKIACTDRNCPFHGSLSVRGQIFEGVVVSDGMQSTVVVKRGYMRTNRKYERLEKRSSKYSAHSPPCLDVGKGDHVKIMECRPLSKMVSFVVIERTEG